MKNHLVAGMALAMLAASPNAAISQHGEHQHHAANMNADRQMPVEPGQAAFAAIAEIVAILAGDPDTDWGRVDIDALRNHLVDMDELALGAEVEVIEEGQAIIFVAMGTGRTLGALRRMVPAHAEILNAETGWDASVEPVDSGVRLVINARNPEQMAMLRGLGFFGVMATGAHHQAHHLAIARGEMMH